MDQVADVRRQGLSLRFPAIAFPLHYGFSLDDRAAVLARSKCLSDSRIDVHPKLGSAD
jgi:hypothetical protein